ncbi:hypothetical protein BU23DRAFT_565770 [Bimuria novae-zelandiae CBS 107.79]|uniref:Uncharacterized protein n=1 Tax=Bimuria novae-zelandiae CBS 107.79 TaxID=1447943 RepID=A0A6A5VGF2_9PLEO|nr:hypothetical protein BU23DRAFT_565770 [Bimuria novae-zelandiae CBS 107.79]
MGHAPEDLHLVTWYEFHVQNVNKASGELSKELLGFLKGAYDLGGVHHFHYYASGLLYPGDDMFAFLDQICGYKEHQVNIYDGYHRRLKSRKLRRSDQHTNTAIMCMSIHDTDGLCQPDRINWLPLEDILAAWLDMLRVGKVKAEPPGVGSIRYYSNKFDPWILLQYSNKQLEEAVSVFDSLVTAIESRMPQLDPDIRALNVTMFDQETLTSAKIPRGFVFEFPRKVRQPRFRFIAPGLDVATPQSISNQPFFNLVRL